MTRLQPRPKFTASSAVARALAAVGTGTYWLGTGDDDTPIGGKSDCCGFATCYCYGIHRKRPGFNSTTHGVPRQWPGSAPNDAPTVVDDINCNSSIEDSLYTRDLFEPVATRILPGEIGRLTLPAEPRAGDLIKYPTIHLAGHPQGFCGHEAIVVDVSRAAGKWNPYAPNWALLDVVQMCGPNDHHPGILRTDASHWNKHDMDWSKPEHRVWLLRVVP
jgi:hypothetical protein